jgi:hypothetical protein
MLLFSQSSKSLIYTYRRVTMPSEAKAQRSSPQSAVVGEAAIGHTDHDIRTLAKESPMS